MLRKLCLLVRNPLKQHACIVLDGATLRLSRECIVKELPDLVALMHNGRRYIILYVFQRLEPCFQSLGFLSCLYLTDVGCRIDSDNLRSGRRKEWWLDIFVFELTGELVEFGTNADGIESLLVLRVCWQREEDGDDWENAEKGIP